MKAPFFTRHLLAAAIFTSVIGLTACGSDNDTSDSYQNSRTYLSETPYSHNEGDYQITNADSIEVMSYNMPGVAGKNVKATAMVMTPKGEKPKDGWRILVWAHGTVGVGDSCAPSNTTFTNDRFSAMADQLLAQGYMIVTPDYEGLGTKGIHPYLNLGSEARSAIYAVNAVKEHYKTNIQGNWMSVGQSQGGHAVLGIAEYAANDSSYKGTVAGAPASSLGYIITKVAPVALGQLVAAGQQSVAVEAYAELLAYAAYTAVGIKAYEPSYDYQNLFSARAAEIATSAEGTTGDNGICLTDLHNKYADDIRAFLADHPNQNLLSYPGLDVDKFDKDATLQAFLKATQPATKKLNTPTLIIQGQADMAVPYQVTETLQQNLKAMGTDVTFELVAGASHTQAIVDKRPDLIAFIKKHMPAQ
ncbi:MAG: alpha/beta hydrolase [Moraxellaceae bacterium]|nr:MAG: alpha/beta hydrolase [Moraxellaceae bacterium]